VGLRPRLSDPTFLVLYLLPSSPMGHLHCEYFLCLRLGNRCVPKLLRVLRSFEGEIRLGSTILPDYWVGCSVTSRSGWRAPGSSNSSNAPIFTSRPGSHCSCLGGTSPNTGKWILLFSFTTILFSGMPPPGRSSTRSTRMAGNDRDCGKTREMRRPMRCASRKTVGYRVDRLMRAA